MSAAAPAAQAPQARVAGDQQFDSAAGKSRDVRTSNILAAKAVSDLVRTSLGPRGMDKMIQSGNGDVIITNDGATILNKIEVGHPAAKMLVELSKSQDSEAGDGTTSVVVIAGALLGATQNLMAKGIHPTVIAESFSAAAIEAEKILEQVAIPIDLSDRESLIKAATTSLASKVVYQNASLLAPIAVDSVLKVIDPSMPDQVDLRNIKIVQKLGGTLDDCELVEGLVFPQKAVHAASGPTSVKNAKIALIQFCLSPPKTDIENSVVISDYTQMDRVLKEERQYQLELVKKIQKTGCNVLLVQKSILRDALTDLSKHFLAKCKIMCVSDIERDEIEFIAKTLGCLPVASPDALKPEKLGSAELVQEVSENAGSAKLIKITGVPKPCRTCSILVRGSNKLMLEEADRSIHDALCVIRCLVKKKFLIAGGGAPEIQVSQKLTEHSKSLSGIESYCLRAFAEALEVVPLTLAENAGLHPITMVTELRNRHLNGETSAGINVKKGCISNMVTENVLQPLLVSTSAINLAAECVKMLLKIDDLVLGSMHFLST